MKFLNSSYTGRASRSMSEAFGPYTSHDITDIPQPMDWQDCVVIAASSIALVAVLLIAFWPA